MPYKPGGRGVTKPKKRKPQKRVTKPQKKRVTKPQKRQPKQTRKRRQQTKRPIKRRTRQQRRTKTRRSKSVHRRQTRPQVRPQHTSNADGETVTLNLLPPSTMVQRVKHPQYRVLKRSVVGGHELVAFRRDTKNRDGVVLFDAEDENGQYYDVNNREYAQTEKEARLDGFQSLV